MKEEAHFWLDKGIDQDRTALFRRCAIKHTHYAVIKNRVERYDIRASNLTTRLPEHLYQYLGKGQFLVDLEKSAKKPQTEDPTRFRAQAIINNMEVKNPDIQRDSGSRAVSF